MMNALSSRISICLAALAVFASCTNSDESSLSPVSERESDPGPDTNSDPDTGTVSEPDTVTESDPDTGTGCDPGTGTDSDPLVSPSMPEIPGDGKDNDCVGGDLKPSDEIGVFVSTQGDDAHAGTIDAPVATLARAIELAQQSGKVVFAAGDIFRESVTTRVSLFGGYDGDTWVREGRRTVLYAKDAAAITVLGDEVVVDNFDIYGSHFPEMNGLVSLGATVYITNNIISGTNIWDLGLGFYGYPAVFSTRSSGVRVEGGRASIVHNVIGGGSLYITPLSNEGDDIDVDIESTGVVLENVQAVLSDNMLMGGAASAVLAWGPGKYVEQPQSWGYDTSTSRVTSDAVKITGGSVRLTDNDIYQGLALVEAFPGWKFILPPDVVLSTSVSGVRATDVEDLHLGHNEFYNEAPGTIPPGFVNPNNEENDGDRWLWGGLYPPSSGALLAARQSIDAEVESLAVTVTGARSVTLESNRIRSVPVTAAVISQEAGSSVRALSAGVDFSDCGEVTLINNGAVPAATTVNSFAAKGSQVEAATISLRAGAVEDCAAIHNTFLTTNALGIVQAPPEVPPGEASSIANGILLEETSATLVNNVIRVDKTDQRTVLKTINSSTLIAGNDFWFNGDDGAQEDDCLLQTADACLQTIEQVEWC